MCKHGQQQASPTARVLEVRRLHAVAGFRPPLNFLPDHPCLLSPVCQDLPIPVLLSRAGELLVLPTLGGMEALSFTAPAPVQWQMMLLFCALQSPLLEFCRILYFIRGFFYYYYYLTWQSFIGIKAKALLWEIPLLLFHSSWVVNNSIFQVIFPLEFPTLTFSSYLLYTLALHLLQLALRFSISPPRFPIALLSNTEETALASLNFYSSQNRNVEASVWKHF